MSRNETAHIYDRLDQHLIGGGRDRDRILDEVIRARKTFIQLSDRGVDKPQKQPSAGVPFLSRAPRIWSSYNGHGELSIGGRQRGRLASQRRFGCTHQGPISSLVISLSTFEFTSCTYPYISVRWTGHLYERIPHLIEPCDTAGKGYPRPNHR